MNKKLMVYNSVDSSIGWLDMKSKLFVFFLLLIPLLLSACIASEKTLLEALSKTQTAMPTATLIPSSTLTPTPTVTPTPIPLSDYNLENILIVKGDLPDGYYVDPFIHDITGTKFEDFNGIAYYLAQRFGKEGEGFGYVSVLLFENLDDRDEAYSYTMLNTYNDIKEAVDNTVITEINDIGDSGKLITSDNTFMRISVTGAYVGFTRCHAFVFIGKTMDDSSLVMEYAKKLDDRLKEEVCPVISY